ncbi:ORF MSV091 hypothetical protein [Melanoplus sanguinipes entomopoxvirus]|uniref:Uncharacterized protein n=1 Tax=Melanoplus sanguinipes entomopoxvirus TaxID=83191 RepID=Q9YW01_MSEPV|nr:ORF MSV091 hypothetical protein [Melanoplus sanguinipes entomopoxvirus]AAC97641.1 ORF MSV091 hypothetical protein [Melanoplus sanguinipes entomopoxvirus 'O']
MNNNITNTKMCLDIIELTNVLTDICIKCQEVLRTKYFKKIYLKSNYENSINEYNITKEIQNEITKIIQQKCNH